jgi:hypothetical protein
VQAGQSRRRTRSLSSSKRAGRFAFSESRRLHKEFLRRNWQWLLLLDVMAVAAALPVLILEDRAFLRGLVTGSLVTMIVAFDIVLAMLHTGTGPRIMGGTAEQWTVDSLRAMEKHGYALINHTGLHPGDMDHVLVGPGGVYLLETKWSATAWDISPDSFWLTSASAPLLRGMRALELFLRPQGVQRVEGVLVLWGQAGSRLRESSSPIQRTGDGVVVLPGEALERWMLGRPRGALDDTQSRAAAAKLAEQTLRRDAHEVLTPTIGAFWLGVVRVVGLTLLGLFAPAYVLSWLPRAVGAALLLSAVVGCLRLRRSGSWRVAATTAASTLSLWVLVLAIDAATRA